MTGRLVKLEYSRHASKAKIMKSNLIWVIGICAMASLLLYLNANILTITVVSGNSMYPTVENGDILLVDKVNRNASKGDVILAKIMDSDREYIIKRVIATGGEEVTIDYSKNAVMVNGMLLDEPYICLAEADPNVGFGWRNDDKLHCTLRLPFCNGRQSQSFSRQSQPRNRVYSRKRGCWKNNKKVYQYSNIRGLVC